MKLSAFIKQCEELIRLHGDIEIYWAWSWDSGAGISVDVLEDADTHSKMAFVGPS
jgi:hypothetical protein